MDTKEIISYIQQNNIEIYITFLYYNHKEELNGLIFANKYENKIENNYDLGDINTGNADLTCGNSIGYLVELNDCNLTIKATNHVNYDLSGQILVTVLEDMGCFEKIIEKIGLNIMREVSINEDELTIKAIDQNDNNIYCIEYTYKFIL